MSSVFSVRRQKYVLNLESQDRYRTRYNYINNRILHAVDKPPLGPIPNSSITSSSEISSLIAAKIQQEGGKWVSKSTH
jgi:hypothetical protein